MPKMAQKYYKILKFHHFAPGTKFAYIIRRRHKMAKKGLMKAKMAKIGQKRLSALEFYGNLYRIGRLFLPHQFRYMRNERG